MDLNSAKSQPMSVICAFAYLVISSLWVCVWAPQLESLQTHLSTGLWISFLTTGLSSAFFLLAACTTDRKRSKLVFGAALMAAMGLASIRSIPIKHQGEASKIPVQLSADVFAFGQTEDGQWGGKLRCELGTLTFTSKDKPHFGAVKINAIHESTANYSHLNKLSCVPNYSQKASISILERWRQKLRDQLKINLHSKEYGMARALVLGERDAIAKSRYYPYRGLGLLHLLAVSGMHLICLDWILRIALKKVPYNRAFRLSILLLAALTAGFRPAVVRAMSVLSVRELMRIHGRDCSSIKLWAFALWAECFFLAPRQSDIGFILSYSATAGLLWSLPAKSLDDDKDATNKLIKTIFISLKLSLAASLATTPCLHAIQGTVEPWSVLLTPLIGIFLPFRLLLSWLCAIPLPDFAHPLAYLPAKLLTAMGNYEESVLSFFDGLSGSPVFATHWPGLAVTGFCLSLLVVLGRVNIKVKIGGLICCLISTLFIATPPPAKPGMSMMKVGHGLATIIAGNSKTILFDFGSRFRDSEELFYRLLLPELRRRGWRMPDELIASHKDTDHFGGLWEVHKQTSAPFLSLPNPGLSLVEKMNPFKVSLWRIPANTTGSGNDGGQVLQINYQGQQLVIMGDQDASSMHWLSRQVLERGLDKDEQFTTLILPHHGLNLSGLNEIIHSFNVDTAWASCSNHDLPLPCADLLSRQSIPLATTAEDGTFFWPNPHPLLSTGPMK